MEEKLREELTDALIRETVRLGYPAEFGKAIAIGLGTESTMRRMIGYLKSAAPGSMEEIADEMMAILADRDKWMEKKKSEYYNQKYNLFLREGLDEDE